MSQKKQAADVPKYTILELSRDEVNAREEREPRFNAGIGCDMLDSYLAEGWKLIPNSIFVVTQPILRAGPDRQTSRVYGVFVQI